jgi:hypothetical protein
VLFGLLIFWSMVVVALQPDAGHRLRNAEADHRKRLWRAPVLLAMVFTARQVGMNSPHFWWSLLILLVALALALTFRYLTDRHSGSNGQRPNNHQPCGSN